VIVESAKVERICANEIVVNALIALTTRNFRLAAIRALSF
jgi:hypothetical protein